MHALRNYSKISLSTQLQISFLISVLIICASAVVVTRFQLDWQKNEMLSGSEHILKISIISQMKHIASEEALFFTQEFHNYFNLVNILTELNKLSFGFSTISQSLFNVNLTPIRSDRVKSDYSSTLRSVYLSNIVDLSEIGNITLYNCTSIDYVLPYLFDKAYLSLYEGLAKDEILNYYPGSYFSASYTPIVREWYYRAVDDPNHLVITEPYVDATTGNWILTISRAVTNEKLLVSVAALDIMLSTITEKTSKIKILEEGFALLVTAAGLIITMPESWRTEIPYRIYDQLRTGINHKFWEVIKASPAGSSYDYTGIDGSEYIFLVQPIMPIENNNTVTHYLLLFASKDEIYRPVTNLKDDFNTLYMIIFWTILSISLCVLITSAVMIYLESRRVTKKIQGVEKVLKDYIRGALFPLYTQCLDLSKATLRSRGIESLVFSLLKKIEKIGQKEESFYYFKWCRTRPNDYSVYSKWETTAYPFNKLHDKTILHDKLICKLSQAQ